MARFHPPGDCPVCGEDVPARARSCRHCGATAESGWNEEAVYDGLDLPDAEEFNYDEFLENEFGKPRRRPRLRIWFWVAVGLITLLIVISFGLMR